MQSGCLCPSCALNTCSLLDSIFCGFAGLGLCLLQLVNGVVQTLCYVEEANDGAIFIDDRKVTEVVFDHDAECLDSRVIHVDTRRIWRHDQRDSIRVRIDVLGNNSSCNVSVGDDSC